MATVEYRLPLDYLEKFMVDVLVGAGVPVEDAKMCGKVLIAADIRGLDTHGIQRLKLIYIDRIRAGILNPITNFEIVKETPSTAVVDGHNGMGIVVTTKCMQMCIEKAKQCGIAMVVARNSTHYGIAGYYSTMAAEHDMIGFNGTNARPSICPTWGVEPMLGTNPLVFAFPSDEPFPWCLDCATSVVQRGKIELYGRENKEIPSGWVIDNDGNYRTDTQQILKDLVTGKAACLPLGGAGEATAGYKGYGYGMIVEILSSCLQAGNHMKQITKLVDGKRGPIMLGHFFMAIDIKCFREPAEFKKQVGDICREIRASKKAAGHDRIWTPGEKEYEQGVYRKEHGVYITPGLQPEMVELRDTYKLDYSFPWEK